MQPNADRTATDVSDPVRLERGLMRGRSFPTVWALAGSALAEAVCGAILVASL